MARRAAPRSILITGASSGIGAALARHYARAGVSLALSGRDTGRLDAVAHGCREAGAAVRSLAVDVTDEAAMSGWIGEVDEAAPLDLVFANAGIGIDAQNPDQLGNVAARTFAVNVTGVFNTIHPAISLMRPRGRGQIAIVSSLAGFHGMARSAAYCASKAAVKSYGEGLRNVLAPAGISVNVICPGFVETPINADVPVRPFLMDTDRAARIIADGLAADRPRIAFPLPMLAAVRLIEVLPESWAQALLRPRGQG
jgi:short-subunit dehydrogenase